MAFRDSFHEVVPGYRINGEVLVFAVKGIKEGGIGSGSRTLEIGNFGISHVTLIEHPDETTWSVPESYIPVDDIDAIYNNLELAGLSTVVDGVLVNPANVALLDYGDNYLMAESVGADSRFLFERSSRGSWVREGNKYLVPSNEFDNFKILALARLSTVLEVVGQTSNSYIHFDGSNDFIEFSAKGSANSGLLDWTSDWTVGMTLVEFDVKSDGKFVTLFSSGSNAIMLRRGGANHGLYVTGNGGATKIGANTWYAPNAGGKLLFSFDSASSRLKYYIGNVDGSYALRANYLVNVGAIGGNTPGTEFSIGKRVNNNAVAESLMFHGGANNTIVSDQPLAGPLVQEYFQVSETYNDASFYADLTSWIKMGEDTYPTVNDTLSAMTGGELIGGTEDDFVEIPDISVAGASTYAF